MAEAIRDQWVIVAAIVGLAILLAWLVVARWPGGGSNER